MYVSCACAYVHMCMRVYACMCVCVCVCVSCSTPPKETNTQWCLRQGKQCSVCVGLWEILRRLITTNGSNPPHHFRIIQSNPRVLLNRTEIDLLFEYFTVQAKECLI